MRGLLGGSRGFLRKLREISAAPINARARIDTALVQIAQYMMAEACSVYVRRSDRQLELYATYATEGLNRKAVHLTTMKEGEGLVGVVAQTAAPLAVSDAQEHPAFFYRPETGEEVYHSFLGVPILREDVYDDVLVVQNKVRRSYSEEEVETLQTTALFMALQIDIGEMNIPERKKTAPDYISTVAVSDIPQLSDSKNALNALRVTLNGFAGSDIDQNKLGNLKHIPLISSDLEMVKVSVDAALDIHNAPKLTKHHAKALLNLMEFLDDFNKVLVAMTDTTDKATKFVKSATKLGATIVASGTGAVVFAHNLSPIILRATVLLWPYIGCWDFEC